MFIFPIHRDHLILSFIFFFVAYLKLQNLAAKNFSSNLTDSPFGHYYGRGYCPEGFRTIASYCPEPLQDNNFLLSGTPFKCP